MLSGRSNSMSKSVKERLIARLFELDPNGTWDECENDEELINASRAFMERLQNEASVDKDHADSMAKEAEETLEVVGDMNDLIDMLAKLQTQNIAKYPGARIGGASYKIHGTMSGRFYDTYSEIGAFKARKVDKESEQLLNILKELDPTTEWQTIIGNNGYEQIAEYINGFSKYYLHNMSALQKDVDNAKTTIGILSDRIAELEDNVDDCQSALTLNEILADRHKNTEDQNAARQQLRFRLNILGDAFSKASEAWSKLIEFDGTDAYLFDKSFDDVATDVCDWVENAIDLLNEEVK